MIGLFLLFVKDLPQSVFRDKPYFRTIFLCANCNIAGIRLSAKDDYEAVGRRKRQTNYIGISNCEKTVFGDEPKY